MKAENVIWLSKKRNLCKYVDTSVLNFVLSTEINNHVQHMIDSVNRLFCKVFFLLTTDKQKTKEKQAEKCVEKETVTW